MPKTLEQRFEDLFGDQGLEILSMIKGAGMSVLEICDTCGSTDIDDNGCFDCFMLSAFQHVVEEQPLDSRDHKAYYEEEAFKFLEGFMKNKGKTNGQADL